MKFVTIASFPDLFEANVMKFRLENEGIECFLLDEHLASIRPHLAGLSTYGVRLQVVEKDVGAALKVLKEANYDSNEYPGISTGTRKNINRYFIPIFLAITVILWILFNLLG